MRRLSIKARLTLWYAIFFVLITAMIIVSLTVNQHRLSRDYYFEMLTEAMDAATASLRLENGEIRLEADMDSGVRVTVLDESGNLLQGKRRFSSMLKDGILHVYGDAETEWYMMDKLVELEDDRNVWLRCYISSTLSELSNDSTLKVVLLMVPFLLAAVIGGGYLMTKRAFRPLDEITRTAQSISGSKDLKQRIQLEERTDEVGRLADTFDSMFERLDHSLEGEKRFISVASHELRTPLSVICSQSEYALMEGRTTEEKDDALRIILERSRKTTDMLSRMLMLSRMDFQKLPIQMESINLSELAENLSLEMQEKADSRDIRIEQEIEKDIELLCDEILMMQLMSNLIENAIQYGHPGGHVRICLSRGRNTVLLRIQDDGVGIDKSEQRKIWRRFYQAGDHRESGSGAGLGLAIVRSIADIHGAEISLQSQKGKGSCFTLSFPDKREAV